MLTADQITTFRRDGFLVVEDVVTPELRARVEAEYRDRLAQLHAAWRAEGRVPELPRDAGFWEMMDAAVKAGVEWFQPLDISLPGDRITEDTPFHFGPAVFDLLTHAPVLDIVESLLGGELTSNPIQHVRIKPPEREVRPGEVRAHIVATDWHQDRGVGLEEADETEMVTVWIAMTDAGEDNGCLQLIPQPTAQMLPHCPMVQTAIAPGHLPDTAPVPAPVRAGGIVLIDPLTPHSARANTSSGYRWSFDIRYSVTGQPTGRAHFPEFIARSRSQPETELRDWRAWRESWVQRRSALARAPHIEQHRWQSDSPACA